MTGNPELPDRKELRRLALDLINSTSTMTLATSGRESAWAAPVYYVYQERKFFFFSTACSGLSFGLKLMVITWNSFPRIMSDFSITSEIPDSN